MVKKQTVLMIQKVAKLHKQGMPVEKIAKTINRSVGRVRSILVDHKYEKILSKTDTIPRIERICVICGKEFFIVSTKPGWLKDPRSFTDNTVCYAKYQKILKLDRKLNPHKHTTENKSDLTKQVRQLYNKGLTRTEIATELGITYRYVLSLLSGSK